jgi:tight adherence protein C
MDDLYDILVGVFGDSSATMLAVLVFLAVAVLAFGLMAAVHTRGAVKRRAGGINTSPGDGEANEPRSLRHSSLKAVQRVLDYTTKHYSPVDVVNAKVLRRRMIQAGIFDQRAVAFFFFARTMLAVALAFCVFVFLPMMLNQSLSVFWLCV